MSDHGDHDRTEHDDHEHDERTHEHGDTTDHEHGEATDTPMEIRTTAPQSPYTMRDVGVGIVVTVVGVLVTFVLPLALA